MKTPFPLQRIICMFAFGGYSRVLSLLHYAMYYRCLANRYPSHRLFRVCRTALPASACCKIWKNTAPILEYRYVTNRGFPPLLSCTLYLLTRASTATYRPCVLQEQTSKSRPKTNFFQSKRWRAKEKLGQLYNRLLARQSWMNAIK